MERTASVTPGVWVCGGAALVALVLFGCRPNVGEHGAAPATSTAPADSAAPAVGAAADPMAAVQDYRKRLDANPKDLEAMILLANANYDIQRFGPALELYRRALALDPTNASVRTDMATALRQAGKTEDAVTELLTALAVAPEHAAALYNLGWILIKDKHNVEDGARIWELLLRAHPDYPQAAQLRDTLKQLRAHAAAPAAR